MAIEIKELKIITSVEQKQSETASISSEMLKNLKKEILSECSKQIKTIMNKRDER
jgi:hypothetical protein